MSGQSLLLVSQAIKLLLLLTKSGCLPCMIVLLGMPALCLAQAAEPREQPEEAEEILDQIVVVAHKEQRSIRHIAATITTLNRTTLLDQQAHSPRAMFSYVPGVDTEGAGSRFGDEGINIRGIGGNRVALLVDGVPLADQFAVGSFSNATRDFVDSGFVKSVEVLHGPASALYGSSAIGGVVATRTISVRDLGGEDNRGAELLAGWQAADHSRHLQVKAGIGGQYGDLVAGANWHDGGASAASAAPDSVDSRDFDRRTALLKYGYDLPAGQSLGVSLLHQEARIKSDLRSLLGKGRFRSTSALRGDDRFDLDLASLTLEFGQAESLIDAGVARGYVQQAVARQATLDERAVAATPVSIDRYFEFDQTIRGAELNVWKNLTGRLLNHRIGIGVEYHVRETREFRDGVSTELLTGVQTRNLLGEEFPLRDFPVSRSVESSAFVEDTITLGKLTLIAALRIDRFELSPEPDAMYREDYPFADPVSIDESDLSPKLGLVVALSPAVDVYAQYAHGFRAPPYAEANVSLEVPYFNYRAIPNPDLKSESSDGVDLGIRYRSATTAASLAVFDTRYKDFIESKVRLGADPVSGRILFQSLNLQATRIHGIEASVSHRFGRRWSALDLAPFEFTASAYLANGENKETGAALNSVGPAQAVLGLAWYSADERRQLQIKGVYTAAWDKRDESAGELFKPAASTVFDLHLRQTLGARAELRVALSNITDRSYWYWSDIRGLAADDPVIPYLSRAGRSYSLSLNLSW